jgi:hypothetical protein
VSSASDLTSKVRSELRHRGIGFYLYLWNPTSSCGIGVNTKYVCSRLICVRRGSMIVPQRRSASIIGDGFAPSDTKIMLQVNGTSCSAQLKEMS